ncbi:MAG: hypothetical protein QM796_11220 [Chthoniobacteraceae bacterium]
MTGCTEHLDPAIGPLREVVVKARLDMNGAPNSGALKTEALLARGWFLGMATIQGEASCNSVKLIEVGLLAECIWHGSESDDWPTAPAEAGTHDPNAECNWTGKDVCNRRTLDKAEVEERHEWETDDHTVAQSAAGEGDLKDVAGFPC